MRTPRPFRRRWERVPLPKSAHGTSQSYGRQESRDLHWKDLHTKWKGAVSNAQHCRPGIVSLHREAVH